MIRQDEAVKRGLRLFLFVAFTLSLALALLACGDEPEAPDPERVSVCEVIGGEAPEGVLVIEGQAIPLDELGAAGSTGSLQGFVLTAEGCSAFVAVEDRSRVLDVEEATVAVRGETATFDEVEAGRLRHALDVPENTDAIKKGVPSTVAIGVDGRHIEAYSVEVTSSGK